MSSEPTHIPWYQPVVDDEGKRLALEVLESNYLNDGDVTDRFEETWAAMVHAKHALAVSNCTLGMFLVLKGLRIGPGDEVIVPDLTFIATAHAVELTGARVVLVDIDPRTLTIDISAIQQAITSRTKAIVPVHVSGRGADMEAILSLAQEYGLYVIEDAAEAFMSKQKGTYLGTFGNAGCYSLSPFKMVSTGQGGIIVTNDTLLYEQMVKLKDQGRPVRGSGGDDIHESVGFNLKYTNLQAAIGLGQLTQVPFRMERIRRTLTLYREHLQPNTVTLLPFETEDGELPLWVDGYTKERDALDRYLRNRHIECRRFWRPLHTQTAYRQPDHLFPHSTTMSFQSLWLPSAFTSIDDDILSVCASINDFYGRTS